MESVAGWKSRVADVPREGGSAAAIVDELPLGEHEATAERAEVLRDVRHPNLDTVWEVRRDDGALVVVTEHLEGERLDVLIREGPPPIDVALRVVVDVLAAMAALHGRTPPIAHGAVSASNVVVGADGVARVARAWLFGRDATVAGDLRAVGELVELLIPSATRPKWAAPLADIAAKAAGAPKRDDRGDAGPYASAADMTRDLRLMGRTKIARPGRVAAFVEALAGEAIGARKRALPAPTTPRGATVRLPAAPPRPELLAPVAAPKATGGFRIPKDRSPWLALVLLLLLVGGGSAWYVRARSQTSSTHVPASSPEEPTLSSAALGDVPPPESPAALGSTTPNARATAGHAPAHAPTNATSATSATGRRPYDRSAIF